MKLRINPLDILGLLLVAVIIIGLSGCASPTRPATYTCGDPNYYHPLCEIGR